MTIINATLTDQTIEVDLENSDLEQVISNALDHFDFADHIDTCLQSHDMETSVTETLDSLNFDEYKNAVDAAERKCEVLRVDQENIITALGSIRDALDTMLASIRPLDRYQVRAQRIQGLVLKMNDSDGQSCLEYCKAALEMTQSDNS